MTYGSESKCAIPTTPQRLTLDCCAPSQYIPYMPSTIAIKSHQVLPSFRTSILFYLKSPPRLILLQRLPLMQTDAVQEKVTNNSLTTRTFATVFSTILDYINISRHVYKKTETGCDLASVSSAKWTHCLPLTKQPIRAVSSSVISSRHDSIINTVSDIQRRDLALQTRSRLYFT